MAQGATNHHRNIGWGGCDKPVVSGALHGNSNAAIPYSRYRQANGRNARTYQQKLAVIPGQIDPGDYVVDIGSGHAVAAMEWARHTGAHVTAINGQNAPAFLRHLSGKFARNDANGHIEEEEDGYRCSGPGLRAYSLAQMADAVGYDPDLFLTHQPSPERVIQEVFPLARAVIDRFLLELKNSGVDYRVGRAEDILPTLSGITLGLDLFGGLFYTVTQLELLKLIYRALDDRGEFRAIDSPRSWSLLPPSRPLRGFGATLAIDQPSIFTLQSHPEAQFLKYLAMRRDPDISELDLPYRIAKLNQRVTPGTTDDFTNPEIGYERLQGPAVNVRK